VAGRTARTAALALVLVAAGASCSASDPALEPLRTLPSPGAGIMTGCDTAVTVGRLTGTSTDPWRVWLVTGGGARLDVVWPAGFRVGFAPDAQVYGSDPTFIAREGETVTLGGGLGQALGSGEGFRACIVNSRNWHPGGSPSPS
jgi:hypothetical protein